MPQFNPILAALGLGGPPRMQGPFEHTPFVRPYGDDSLMQQGARAVGASPPVDALRRALTTPDFDFSLMRGGPNHAGPGFVNPFPSSEMHPMSDLIRQGMSPVEASPEPSIDNSSRETPPDFTDADWDRVAMEQGDLPPADFPADNSIVNDSYRDMQSQVAGSEGVDIPRVPISNPNMNFEAGPFNPADHPQWGADEEFVTGQQLSGENQVGMTPTGGVQAGSQADSSDMESMVTNAKTDYVPTPEEQALWAEQDKMDPAVAKQRLSLEEFQNALSDPNVRGGLLTNEQMGAMSPDAQALVNHTAGGNFGQVKPPFRLTPGDVQRLDELTAQQGISGGMENHRFGGNTVARPDATGRPGFFNANDPIVTGKPRPDVNPVELASAEGDLEKKGYIRGPGGFRPSPGRFDEVRSMTGRKAPVPGAVPPPKTVSGYPSLQQRQANVAARGMSRGLQRDFDRGNQTPQSAILSQLDKGGDNPLVAGVMHGNDGYVAALKAKGLRDHDAMMIAQEKAKMDAAMSKRGMLAGAARSGAPGAVEAINALPPDPNEDPVGFQRYKQQEILAQEVGPFENSQQGYVQYMNKAAADGRDQNEAMRIWQAAGRQTGRASDGGVFGQFGNWLMGDRPRAAGGGAGLRSGADILNDAGAAIGGAVDSAGSLLNPKRFSGWAR